MHFLRQFSGCCGRCQPIRYSATAGRGSSRCTQTTWQRRSHKFCGGARDPILSMNWPARTSNSYEELLRTIARIARLRPVLMRIPFSLWDALAGLAERLPQAPLTRNQVELMQIDTTASERLPGFRSLGISPRSLEDELEAILGRSK